MIIDSKLEFTSEQPVIDLGFPGEAIGDELYFNVFGAGAGASVSLATGDSESCSDVIISGKADDDGFFSARVPFGVKRYLKGLPVGKCFINAAPQFSFDKF